MSSNLLQVLENADKLTSAQIELAHTLMEQKPISVPSLLIENKFFTSSALASCISSLLLEPVYSIDHFDYILAANQLNRRDLILTYQMLPLQIEGNILTLAVSDPTDIDAQNEFRFITGFIVKGVLVDHNQLAGAIRKLYGKKIASAKSATHSNASISDSDLAQLADFDEHSDGEETVSDEAPISRYIQQVLFDAIRKQASDIHFEPFEEHFQIRLRLDGMLQLYSSPPVGIARRVSTRLKILAKINIAERRLPQDGRIKLNLTDGQSIDMRVSTLPTQWGEKVVLRILDSSSVSLDIDLLGYNATQKQAYLKALDKPQGMILMTGPTGSGKTVSLYSGLKYLNTEQRNISTAEDPVEINLPGINQVNIHAEINLTFAAALRAFLRQDPDIVMVGEIRDLETAEICIKAAQTGHLVLSTLHTNSAAESITRLSNMGVAQYNLAGSLSLIIAQRLARKLCVHCKSPHPLEDHQLQALTQHYQNLIPENMQTANLEGCSHCNNGYLGRIGIYEVMPITPELAEAIGNGASAIRLENIAKSHGMNTLQLSGIEKLNEGITSLAELQRVISL